jgi:hypothetical protein
VWWKGRRFLPLNHRCIFNQQLALQQRINEVSREVQRTWPRIGPPKTMHPSSHARILKVLTSNDTKNMLGDSRGHGTSRSRTGRERLTGEEHRNPTSARCIESTVCAKVFQQKASAANIKAESKPSTPADTIWPRRSGLMLYCEPDEGHLSRRHRSLASLAGVSDCLGP